MREPPIIVIGAGAAGFLAGVFAAREGRSVVVLERKKDGGRKILISGGGRCNILPSKHEPERFVTASSSNSLRNILRTWKLEDQRTFFERELGMPLVLEEESGKLFPESNSARDVRDMLRAKLTDAGGRFVGDVVVRSITPSETASDPWRVHADRETFKASAVVLATGGLSVPNTGSDGMGLAWVRRLGHTVHKTYPALTSLTSETTPHAHLSGVSLNVTIRAERFETTGGFLFTHRGYSGPAVLDISHLVTSAQLDGGPVPQLVVQWYEWNEHQWDEALQTARGNLGPFVAKRIPARLGRQLLAEAGVDHDRPLAQLTRDERSAVVRMLSAYPLPVTGDEGYRKAEVTGGGVALNEIDPRSMESRRHAGLFLCGEILDAFGPIGGYNFQWAWATGRAAGLGAAHHSAS